MAFLGYLGCCNIHFLLHVGDNIIMTVHNNGCGYWPGGSMHTLSISNWTFMCVLATPGLGRDPKHSC